jgi:hypothetical protein
MVCDDGACVPGPTPTVEGQVIVTEFMARSTAGTDSFEWVELTNTTDLSFDLDACNLTDDNTNTHTIVGPLVVGPHESLLLVRSASETEYGRMPDYVYGPTFSMTNSGDKIILRCGDVTIDSVVYTTPWIATATAIQLSTTAFDPVLNDDLANWCLATSAYNAAPKYGTPGAANFDCAAQ